MTIPGVIYHPRTDWQDPARPVVGPVLPPAAAIVELFVHYEGANLPVPHADATMIARLRKEHTAYLAKKPPYSLGYNFLVDGRGHVWEARGFDFRNAANLGRKVDRKSNGRSVSVQVKVAGAGDAARALPANPAQVDAVRAIVAECRRRGMNVRVRAHRDVDFTGCCGDAMAVQVAGGVFEPIPPPPPPPPPPPDPDPPHPPDPPPTPAPINQGAAMWYNVFIYNPPWGHLIPLIVTVTPDETIHMTNGDTAVFDAAAGVPRVCASPDGQPITGAGLPGDIWLSHARFAGMLTDRPGSTAVSPFQGAWALPILDAAW